MFIANIIKIFTALRKTEIEVYEWDESVVRQGRLQNAPDFYKLTKKRANLTFSGWALAHSIVKADYLDKRNLTMPGLGFLLQANDLIDFSKSSIELKPRASEVLNDFSLTSLSGRVGQGIAILYGHHLGLKFTSHLSSHVNSLHSTSSGIKHKKEKMADFLFADTSNKTYLIESKGTFTQTDNNPSKIKSVLKSALQNQVDPWMKRLNPLPSNGYVVYSCLREGSWCPSSLSVVDPSNDNDESAVVPFNPEQVMRENYGTWLRVMGLPQAAKRLIRLPDTKSSENYEPIPTKTRFMTVKIGEREFALPYLPYIRFPHLPFDTLVVGIDLSVLMAISTVIESPDLQLSDLLISILPKEYEQKETVSIFPDGSFLGMIHLRSYFKETIISI